ncbi:DNA repair protein RecO [Candidatus Roizmanbacteria bacterium CG09_land_8_20_14_0_10_41_9]|uniref:DNA repair protein RecO n=1 Tax=Candidatus Roizmanbacteria bacterium CG09_land_8_20_14_0_10_41_9 TaxID=1974850 RepID=A0A2H0WVC5_9BACT|nr:MAG: DNA repair protein RecO [Candidatus Roizmanbacteria bacterium CG09_land_8_20_14_0_10_41_9]
MLRAKRSEAIVLRKRTLLNKDVLLTFFSSEFGKIQVIAKGIKKITSRRSSHMQTANLVQILVQNKDERFFLQETSLTSAFSQIKNNDQKIQVLYFFLFTLERILPENQNESDVYKLSKQFLVALSRSDGCFSGLLTLYLNKMLRLLGYIQKDKELDDLKLFIEEIIHEKTPPLII